MFMLSLNKLLNIGREGRKRRQRVGNVALALPIIRLSFRVLTQTFATFIILLDFIDLLIGHDTAFYDV